MKAAILLSAFASSTVSAFAGTRFDPRQVVDRTGPLVPHVAVEERSCAAYEDIESCSGAASPGNVDSCCVETYGGLGVMTQFWSTHTGLEDQGQLLPAQSWTIHGLWPDFCNGSYTSYCVLSRQYDPDPSPSQTEDGTEIPPWTGASITEKLESLGRLDLVEYMEANFVSQGGPSDDLWAHEYSKHGTCFSTLQIACYGPDFVQDEDMIDYFETTIASHEDQPTYDWLAGAGIVPSNTTTYTYADIEQTLTDAYGAVPYLGCGGPSFSDTEAGAGSDDNGATRLYEAWYFRHFNGRPQDGNYVAVDSKRSSGCATSEGAINYFEIAPGSVRDT